MEKREKTIVRPISGDARGTEGCQFWSKVKVRVYWYFHRGARVEIRKKKWVIIIKVG